MSRKKIKLLLYLVPVAAALCVVSAPALPQTMSMSNPNSNDTPRFRVHQAVEEKARLLQDNDQDTHRALADEIFKASRGFEVLTVLHGIGPTEIPPSIDYVIKDRLVWAEMRYRRGLGKGVKEQSIVDFTNLLVEKFGLPDYARTSKKQVRFMRMFLMVHNPVFMGRGAARPDIKVGESINEEMSPLQAVHVLLEVLGHKCSDQNFQLTPEEWDREQASRSTQTKATQTGTTHQVVVSINPKEAEIRSSLARQMNSITPTEALSLMDKAFEVLGIER